MLDMNMPKCAQHYTMYNLISCFLTPPLSDHSSRPFRNAVHSCLDVPWESLLAPLRALMIRLFPAMRSRGTHRQYGLDAYGLPTYQTSTHHSGTGHYENHVSSKENGPRRHSSITSDRSEIPLKQVLQTKEVRMDYSDAQSSWGADGDVDRRQWGNAL